MSGLGASERLTSEADLWRGEVTAKVWSRREEGVLLRLRNRPGARQGPAGRRFPRGHLKGPTRALLLAGGTNPHASAWQGRGGDPGGNLLEAQRPYPSASWVTVGTRLGEESGF